MANYVKATNFYTKDALSTGNPAKIIKGAEIDDEFNAIATAVNSKADTTSPTFTGTPLAPTATAGNNTTQIATTAFVQNVAGALGTMSTQNKTAVDITGGTIAGVTVAGTFTGNITGNVTGNVTGNATGSSGSCTGNAATATALSTASGSAPSYSNRAWVNFNGTGTVAIRASQNVSSITDNGAGDYTINFSTAMADADYSVSGAVNGFVSGAGTYSLGINTLTSSSSRVVSIWTNGGGNNTAFGFVDASIVTATITR
jgi:hypothetical protein